MICLLTAVALKCQGICLSTSKDFVTRYTLICIAWWSTVFVWIKVNALWLYTQSSIMYIEYTIDCKVKNYKNVKITSGIVHVAWRSCILKWLWSLWKENQYADSYCSFQNEKKCNKIAQSPMDCDGKHVSCAKLCWESLNDIIDECLNIQVERIGEMYSNIYFKSQL